MAEAGARGAATYVSHVVVDTSVVSYLLKQHSLAASYQKLLGGKLLGISFMTVAELYRWPLERNWGAPRIESLLAHLRAYVVLPQDDALCWEWARIMARKGRPVSSSDAWIAATAIRHAAPLITHNVRHFQGIDNLAVLSIPAD